TRSPAPALFRARRATCAALHWASCTRPASCGFRSRRRGCRVATTHWDAPRWRRWTSCGCRCASCSNAVFPPSMPRSKPVIRIAIVALTATLLLACQPGGKGSAATAGTTDAPAAVPGAVDGQPTAPSTADTAVKKDVTHPALVVTTLDGSEYDLAARRGKW